MLRHASACGQASLALLRSSRLQKNPESRARLVRGIWQGLKHYSFYWLYRHATPTPTQRVPRYPGTPVVP
jgi:hypothetical protein